MKKEITIGFRTDKDIRNALEKMAKIERRSLSSVIETILYHHLKEKKLLEETEK
jgi:hypothetical protein